MSKLDLLELIDLVRRIDSSLYEIQKTVKELDERSARVAVLLGDDDDV